MDFTALKERLEQNNFTVTTFATGAEAARYLNEVVDGKTVGFGGSMTLKELGLYESLSAHNEVHWHWVNGPEEREKAMATQVYMASVNAIAADEGALLNIDGSPRGVSIENAKYPLKNAEITCDYPYGISNEPLPGQTARVSLREGRLLLIKVR